MRFVCFRCGYRQESDTARGSCSTDIVHDLGERSTWPHLRDIERRLGRQRQARITGIVSLVVTMVGIGLYMGALVYYGRTGRDMSSESARALIAVTLGVALALVAILEKTWGESACSRSSTRKTRPEQA